MLVAHSGGIIHGNGYLISGTERINLNEAIGILVDPSCRTSSSEEEIPGNEINEERGAEVYFFVNGILKHHINTKSSSESLQFAVSCHDPDSIVSILPRCHSLPPHVTQLYKQTKTHN